MARWVDLIRRAAAVVVVGAVLTTIATAGYVATHMRINTSTTDMLSPDLPFRQHSRQVSEAFPKFSDNLLVVIDGQTPDLVDDAADMLAARLRQRPEVFGEVLPTDWLKRNRSSAPCGAIPACAVCSRCWNWRSIR